MRPERLADREITELHSGGPPLSDRNAVTRRSHPTGRVQRASSLFPWRLPSAARSRHEGGRGGGTIASGPAAPSTIGMMMAEVHGRSSPRRTPWLRSLIAADTCADVRVFVGRRLLPAGPPAEERKGGGEGRERPGLPRIWVGTGPASRVAHAPCQCPDRPDKRGPDRVQIRTQLRAQIQITIAPAVVLAIELPRCRTVGSRTDGRSPVHTEAARPAETGRRLAARRVHDAARRLVRQHPADRPTSASAFHQRTVSTSGRHSDPRSEAPGHGVSGCGVRKAVHRRRRRRGHR